MWGGVAGVMVNNKGPVYTNITHGKIDYRPEAFTHIDEPIKVDCLDELFFFIKKDKFKPFDDYGPVWHFYAVEQCLRAKTVLCFPLDVFHLSPGNSLNNSYYSTLKKVAKKYKDHKIIPTTMGYFRNNILLYLQIAKGKLGILKRKLLKK